MEEKLVEKKKELQGEAEGAVIEDEEIGRPLGDEPDELE